MFGLQGRLRPDAARGLGWIALALGAWVVGRMLLRHRPFDVAGKTVLITGGSRGLGLILARRFAAEGARVAICARDPVTLERARADLVARRASVLALAADVRVPDQVTEVVRIVEEFFGPVDVLVNNAGEIAVGPVEAMTEEDFASSLDVHFWAPFHAIQAVLPDMMRRGQGRIVNISSIGGKVAVPHLLPYTAGKFALTGFSEALHTELAKDGIVVTTVCPGLMRTGSPANAFFKSQFQKEYAWFSILASLPVTSISADRAARQIVDAVRYGRAELIISLQAKIAARLYGLMPATAQRFLAMVNGWLPGYAGIGPEQVRGQQSHSKRSPSWLTVLSDQAAVRNNEVA